MDIHADMCVDKCVDMSIDMCVGMCVHMRTDMCVGIFVLRDMAFSLYPACL